MITLLAAGALAHASPGFDLSLAAGAVRATPAPLSVARSRPSIGLVAGTDLGFDPLRLELQGSVSALPYDGSDAVIVRGSRLEGALLVGWHGTFFDRRVLDFGVDALAGPALLRTSATVSVYRERTTSHALDVRAALSAGPWISLGPIVLSGRFQVYAPVAPQWTAYGTLGVRF